LFIQRLAQFLTSWEATTFLIGEYAPEEMRDNPLFTIADGLIWLWQVVDTFIGLPFSHMSSRTRAS
jgi:circadian clock protein KaiC